MSNGGRFPLRQVQQIAIASVREDPDPNGNRAQRRAAKKLKIKAEHVVKEENA